MDGPKKTTTRTMRRPVRQELFDELERLRVSQTQEIAENYSAALATVVGREIPATNNQGGQGKVRVRFDDEDEDRSIGIVRAKGVMWEPGDRAVVLRNRSGEEIAGFPVTGGSTSLAEEAVGNKQLIVDAVDGRALKYYEVGSNHLTDQVWNKVFNSIQVDTWNNFITKDYNPLVKFVNDINRDLTKLWNWALTKDFNP